MKAKYKLSAILFPVLLIMSGISGQVLRVDSTSNHWGQNGNLHSPLTFSGVLVPSGITLVIDPGTLVEFTNPNGGIDIEAGANMIARGTETQPIVFRPTGSKWSGIDVSSEITSILEFCIIHSAEAALDLEGNASVTRCQIHSCPQGITTMYGAEVVVSVSNSVFVNSMIRSYAEGAIQYVNNTIYIKGRFAAIDIDGGNPIFRNNLIASQLHQAIFLRGEGEPIFINTLCSGFKFEKGENTINQQVTFRDVENLDLHIPPYSPAIDAGDPTSPYGNEPSPNGCRVNIGAYGNTPEAAESRIEIVIPNGGEALKSGAAQNIEWKSSRYSGPKVLAFSLDGGLNWATIDTVTVDSGSYPWIIPDLVDEHAQCKMKISYTSCSEVSDVSDGAFTISPDTHVQFTRQHNAADNSIGQIGFYTVHGRLVRKLPSNANRQCSGVYVIEKRRDRRNTHSLHLTLR